MLDVMGIVNLYEKDDLLQKLADHRPIATLPFAGRYRLIDFVLSNMVNSGITNIGVLTGVKARSVMDHLRSGKEWDLARRRDGLFLLPTNNSMHSMLETLNNIDDLYSHLGYIACSKQSHVLVSNTKVVCSMNFKSFYDFHLKSNADITMLYKTEDVCSFNKEFYYSALEADVNGRVFDLALGNQNSHLNKVNLNIMLFKKNVLMDLIADTYAHGGVNLLKDGIIRNMSKFNIYACEYKGYTARMASIEEYFKNNLAVLDPDIRQELFADNWPIYTKIKDEAPTKYNADADVKNSMLANGCIISGAVNNSILSRGVKVEKGASLNNAVIMQNCTIGRNVVLENVICDKNVIISDGKTLKGDINYPLVISKNKMI